MFCIPVVSKYWSRVHRHAFQQNPSGAAGGPAYRGSGARKDPEQYRLARESALAGFAGRQCADQLHSICSPLMKEARAVVTESAGPLHQTIMSTWFAGMRSGEPN